MSGALTASLNEALAACPRGVVDTLHLSGFAEVTLEDYQGIVEVEEFSIARGYPQLN